MFLLFDAVESRHIPQKTLSCPQPVFRLSISLAKKPFRGKMQPKPLTLLRNVDVTECMKVVENRSTASGCRILRKTWCNSSSLPLASERAVVVPIPKDGALCGPWMVDLTFISDVATKQLVSKSSVPILLTCSSHEPSIESLTWRSLPQVFLPNTKQNISFHLSINENFAKTTSDLTSTMPTVFTSFRNCARLPMAMEESAPLPPEAASCIPDNDGMCTVLCFDTLPGLYAIPSVTYHKHICLRKFRIFGSASIGLGPFSFKIIRLSAL